MQLRHSMSHEQEKSESLKAQIKDRRGTFKVWSVKSCIQKLL